MSTPLFRKVAFMPNYLWGSWPLHMDHGEVYVSRRFFEQERDRSLGFPRGVSRKDL